MLPVLFYGFPAVVFVVGIPLALKMIPPNRFYGFRTSTTFSSLDAWYRINFATGLALLAAGLVSGFAALLLGYGVVKMHSESRYLIGILLTALITLLFLVPVVVYSDRF
jgi:hypothetical protein